MTRLSFQNVPTKSGGVISGNISTGAGSPFGAGGEFAPKVAEIQAEIAKKPKGYYDPILNVSGKVDTSVQAMEIALGMRPHEYDSERITNLRKAYGDARRRENKEGYKAQLDAERIKGTDSLKKIPKNFWLIGLAIVGGYMLYRNIHRN